MMPRIARFCKQRQKDINKAQAETVARLGITLGFNVHDLPAADGERISK